MFQKILHAGAIATVCGLAIAGPALADNKADPLNPAGSPMAAGIVTQETVIEDVVTKRTITDTYIQQRETPAMKKVDFAAFDINGDGQLSHPEIGEKLFRIFDTDGNHVIDNIEYTKPMVMTVIPMVKREIVTVETAADGKVVETKTSEEEFYKQSMLHKFSDNPAGLSAQDFLSRNYWSLDDNGDKMIDVKEWKDAYTESLRPSAANPNRYNN